MAFFVHESLISYLNFSLSMGMSLISCRKTFIPYLILFLLYSFYLHPNCRCSAEGKDSKNSVEIAKERVDEIINYALRVISEKKKSVLRVISDRKQHIASNKQLNMTRTTNEKVIVTKDLKAKLQRSRERNMIRQNTDASASNAQSRMHDLLSAHMITKSHQKEIVGLSTSSIQRNTVIAQVMMNYPDKTIPEANDIVYAANSASGALQPKVSDMTKEESIKSAKNLKKFVKAKEVFMRAKE